MGKSWDSFVPSPSVWRECFRVLKHGGHILCFAGSRTQDLMSIALRLAGFECRDTVMWVYGSGFPKSLDVSKQIDKRGGASVAWFGPWFLAWREQNGVAQKQVAALFPSKTGGLTGCVANWELGLNMPTPEQFNLIRDTFGLPFASVEEAEREVVAQQRGTMLAVAPGQENNRSTTMLDITAPATDAARQWQGWGTALKPAYEPILLFRKPLSAGTVAENVLKHGTGALNIDGCRVGSTVETLPKSRSYAPGQIQPGGKGCTQPTGAAPAGRWPTNLIHDGSEEPVQMFGDAARFFYCAKASKKDRGEANIHPTVKPTDLMRYLCRLITPPDGVILDPFMGSGSTGKAAMLEGFRFIGIEQSPEYFAIARARINSAISDTSNDKRGG